MSHSPNIERGLYVEDLFTLPRPDCMVPAHWHTHDIQGTEVEVIEMVAGMIRGQQPEVVLETGTSRGYMTQAIGNALLRNGHGVVYTNEPDALTLSEAFETWGGDAERLPIIARGQESMQEWTQEPIDFAWHDSLLDLRLPEFNFYLPHYSDRAIVCFHDTAPHFGPWSNELREALLSQGFSYLD